MANSSQHRDPVSTWRHDMRNAMNTLQWCMLAVAICTDKSERLEMIEQVEVAAGDLISLLDAAPPGSLDDSD